MKVQYLLDTAINPAVAGHGGVVSLVDVKDKIVYLQLAAPTREHEPKS
ncbi:MAG: NifU family protein [Candidatus Rokubacteria bacterium]|nr:NifU family protein [Candidatus Rokubacteria bacterium]